MLVVQAKEAELHKKHKVPMFILPKGITTLSPTRQHLAYELHKRGFEKFIMLDDDLTFTRRHPGTGVKLHQLARYDVLHMFKQMVSDLDRYAHVAISAREGNNRVTAPYARITRAMRCVGFRVKEYYELEPLSRLAAMSDFDATLQLLRKGYPNLVRYDWAQNQSGGSNAPGGCSTYRTMDLLYRAAKGLAIYHPGFVTVVEKETKGSWGGGKRHDVQIAWKKAYRSSLNDIL